MAIKHVVRNKQYRSEAELTDAMFAIVAEYDGNMTPDAKAHWNSLAKARDELRATEARIRTATRGAGSTETAEFGQPGFRRERTVDRGTGNAHRDAGLRAVEEQLNSGVMRSE